MTDKKIKEVIAPCGLCCTTCFAHIDGDIRRYSLKLKEKLGNFHINAKRFEIILNDPVFKQYSAFMEMLDYFASENCKGCRKEQCRIFKNCGVRSCHQEKNIDFCFQCDQFPCLRTNFDDALYKVWIQINQKIRKSGIEKFHKSAITRPRYG